VGNGQADIKDYYALLGVSAEATEGDIKAAYRKLARQYHPDRNSDASAEEHFKEIGEAYEVLKDETKRAAYDQLRNGYQQGVFHGAPSWDGSGFRFDYGPGEADDLGELFEGLFGGRTAGHPRPGPRRGQDVEADLEIALETAYRGGSQRISLAGGQKPRALEVKIPAGVTAGQKIRLSGQGGPGPGGGQSGDLILRIVIRPHHRFSINGRDLALTLPIAPWEAALGARVKVPTLSGELEVTVPPESRGGQKLRLRGRGLPGSPAGDLLVQLEIVTPPATDEAMKGLYENMRDSGFDPRKDW
jgi:curved DNA-binding protein